MFSSSLIRQIEQYADDGDIVSITKIESILCAIFHDQPSVNWAGLYLFDKKQQSFFLGPFFGKPACLKISPSNGVIGFCYRTNAPVLVKNVHDFPGHIACDSDSRSELVIPIYHQNRIAAVLDLDSTEPGFFTKQDQALMESVSKILEREIGCIIL